MGISCSPSVGPEKQAGPGASEIEVQQIRDLTDSVLRYLATHDYSALEAMQGSGGNSVSGREAAQMLLGPRAFTMVLDRWNADTIDVRFSEDQAKATAEVPVRYRRSPNSKQTQGVFVVRFARAKREGAWRLTLL